MKKKITPEVQTEVDQTIVDLGGNGDSVEVISLYNPEEDKSTIDTEIEEVIEALKARPDHQ